jgi:L-fuculose-phosphate aldolase
MQFEDMRKQVLEAARKMHALGLTHETSGNVSCRVPGQEKLLITPSRVPYVEMEPRDILLVGFDGECQEEGRSPSIETPLHTAIYQAREDVGAVVHSHSLYALAVAAAGRPVPVFLDEIFSCIGGNLEVAPYALPGSEELASSVVPALGERGAVLLANHGVVCCGKSPAAALAVAQTVERICRIHILAAGLGGAVPLPAEGIEYQEMMYDMHRQY